MKSGKLINDNYFDYLREVSIKRDLIGKNIPTSNDEKFKRNIKLIKSVSQDYIKTLITERIKNNDDNSKIIIPNLIDKTPYPKEENNEVIQF